MNFSRHFRVCVLEHKVDKASYDNDGALRVAGDESVRRDKALLVGGVEWPCRTPMGGPMTGYSVAQLDGIEEFADMGCHSRPIRHRLGITAFGVTAWTAHEAGDRVINEHDEGDPTADEELFLVLRGHAVFELDGDRVDAPAGTLVFAPPGTRRTASAVEDGQSHRPSPRRATRSCCQSPMWSAFAAS
jgi:hypothetical protein